MEGVHPLRTSPESPQTDARSPSKPAYKAVEAVKKLNDDLAIPTLKEVNVKTEDITELAERSAVNVSVDSNPRKVGKDDFKKIFEAAMAH